ncbi:hypothetical protein B0H11DRAFT_958677 [Mycena galericulata]|nr:hypothetical protein B0H11DRAFT_958677 [Mycena galericulata]
MRVGLIIRSCLKNTDLIISSYLHEIRPDLESFLKGPEPLRLWVPEKDLPHADFLKSLKIPMSATNGPDMLLHDLGNFKRNEVLQKLVNKLFHPENSGLNFASTLLLNTSGSGKTRTLLEGLCQMWGLYFTCQVDTEGRGSIDLERTINDRIASDPCFHPHLPSIGFDVVHSANSNIAGRRLGEVLLARLCILEFFCEVAREVSNGNLTDEHRKRWVFLQIRPSCIGQAHVDIFNGLAEKIMGVDSRYRRTLIKNKVGKLAAMNIDNKPLFCVVDEAQVAATSLPRAFMTSGPGVDRQRPILKEIAKAFALPQHSIALNLTGTAIDTSVMMEILASPIFKETGMTTITHFGAFNVPTEQIAYVKEFLPKELAESIPFRRLFKRVAYWLKGRYRFTAAYVKDLLSMGFQRPHRLLNEFIRLSTVVPIPGAIALRMSAGFKLTDSKEDWEEGEAVPSPLKRFDFDKLKKDPTVESLIRAHTAKFWMRSTIDPLIADKRHFDLIRYGFARYADNDVGNHEEAKISLDEPLVLLALGEWLQICDLPLAETLRQNAARAVTEASGANGLEEYLALYLSAVFDDQTPLTDIFRFHEHLDPPDWAKKPAALVSLYYVDDEDLLANNPSEGVVEHHKRPSVTIGKDATNIQETLAWLKHTDTFRAPICFPDKFIGPDLLFILRLQDEARSLIWVALQSKFSSDDALSGETIRSALPTVTPKEFYGLRRSASHHRTRN